MSTDSEVNSNRPIERQAPRKRGLIATIVSYIFSTIGLFFTCLVVSILIEWAGIFFGWWVEAYDGHARTVALDYIGYLTDDLKAVNVDYSISPALFLEWLGKEVQHWFGVDVTSLFTQSLSFRESELASSLMHTFLMSSGYVLVSTLIKLGYLVSAIPVLVILGIQLGADGYVQRMRRVYEGRPDKGSLVSISKFTIGLGFVALTTLYLTCPCFIPPTIVSLLIAMVSAIGIRSLVAYYAKNFGSSTFCVGLG